MRGHTVDFHNRLNPKTTDILADMIWKKAVRYPASPGCTGCVLWRDAHSDCLARLPTTNNPIYPSSIMVDIFIEIKYIINQGTQFQGSTNFMVHDQIKAALRETFSRRLLQARKMRGLSLRDLADLLGDRGVSYNTLHKYERGRMFPSGDVLIALSEALKQPTDFFLRPLKVALQEIEFRKRSRLSGKLEEAIRQEAAEFFERYLEIEEALGVAGMFRNPFADRPAVVNPDEIEKAAIELRTYWNLGTGALPGVIRLLEEKYIKIYEIDSEDEFDGFSGWAGDIPVIVLNRKCPADRKRLSALHELGHLIRIFPKNGIDARTHEKLCMEFAAAMLLPGDILVQELGRHRTHITLKELEDIKARYGISCGAIMMRAHKLGIFTDSFMRSFWILWRKKGFHQRERDLWGLPEAPQRFEQLVIRGVAEELISASKGAALLNEPLSQFRKRLGLLS